MENYLKLLNENQWLNLIFLSLTILSILISIILYRKSRRTKKPVFDKRSINVISDTIKKIGEIDVNFKGSKIDNLTVTKLAFWNDGNDTINDIDQAPKDKLRITLIDQYNILESEVIFQTSTTNNIKTTINNNQIEISFDYLDSRQGGIIKLIHTGKKSSDVELKGTFKGANKIRRINTNFFNMALSLTSTLPILFNFVNSSKQDRLVQRIFPFAVLFTGIGFGIGYVLSASDSNSRPFFLVAGLLYGIVGLIMVFNNKTLPKGFEVFYDDE